MLNDARERWIVSGQCARAKTKTLFIDLHDAVTFKRQTMRTTELTDAFFT